MTSPFLALPPLDVSLPVGTGAVVNTLAVVLGGLLGMLFGTHLSTRTRDALMDILGLFTIVIGIQTAAAMNSKELTSAVPGGAGAVVVLIGLALGTAIGSAMSLDAQLDRFAAWLQAKAHGRGGNRLGEGFVTMTLVATIGPLTILGSMTEGLGGGPGQLLVKSVLDAVTAISFASAMGFGVVLASVGIGLVEGVLILAGVALGGVLSTPIIESITACGGVVLLGLGIKLLRLRDVPVAAMLPSLVVAPLLVVACGWL